ncbi:MAG: hypothetical protein J0I68_28715 [Achromobacter sp.]|uniref:hypothetical protein n=1 Tax=unclassified Achromobacter TaxID=2626865 RepID=UPI0006C41D87|nr:MULTISPECIES: hypothetical protein [unclassified Achromobacter]MBN9642544.1 hypothetical protein [Achromobacter sp.]CUJ43509.1 Uncharacterised protein [Achromobacter sp. 2789STDY5608621]
MTPYSIHYRLGNEKDRESYDQRYRALQEAIDILGRELGLHVDATSTVWMRSSLDGETIAKVLKIRVDPRHDVVLVKPADAPIIFSVGDDIIPFEFEIQTGIKVIPV